MLGYDKRAGTLLTVADAADHPARATAHVPGVPPRRIERFNDTLFATLDLGRHEEVWIKGAQGDRVQMWVFYPPGFDAKKSYPLLHTIHGGPHTAPGDGWHYRWNNKVFAAQGYVVAAVNYHGSSGFGHAFLDSITHRWASWNCRTSRPPPPSCCSGPTSTRSACTPPAAATAATWWRG